MKNLINYYYGLLVKNFKKINEHFIFEIDNVNYEFLPFYGDLNQFYKNYLTLINCNKYFHEVVFNKDKNLITFYNNNPYILIKKNIRIDRNLDIDKIINYDVPIYSKIDIDWKELWKNKIDYYEYQMSQLGIKYKILKNSFDYYIGLSETAISLLNYVEKSDIKYYICHKRINLDEKMDEFLNPVNIIIDSRTRDIAEYIKVNYLNDRISENKVLNYIDNLNFSYAESLLFLARLLYPSYYFDIYDQIIQDKISEEKILYYIKKNSSYEEFLKVIYKYIKNKYKIPEIEWLEI